MNFLHSLVAALCVVTTVFGGTYTENFNSAPTNWASWNPGAVRWDEQAGNLAVTWDSRQTNSFFYFRLPYPMTLKDEFGVEFNLRLDHVELGINPGKNSTFPLCVGFLNLGQAQRTNYFRGSGVNSETGPRSVVEFAYFPDSGFEPTVGPIIASTNNQIAYRHHHPVELKIGQTYRIRIQWVNHLRRLYTPIFQNGELAYTILPLDYPQQFGDFAVDAFSIHSYSDAGQSPPQFAGSLLARGVIDDVVFTFYDHPIGILRSAAPGTVEFRPDQTRTHTLERSLDLVLWSAVPARITISPLFWQLEDTNRPSDRAFYRVRGDWPE
ncbi:MAG TPA: hypothetical protein VM680_17740 [Verrucomicrobiae bacterium]|nr:hypothetical protein [Verrucomicrobiae bacterium]